MLEQIARVLGWLCVGEIAARSGLLPLPAPVTGLILLYAELSVRGKLPDDLGILALSARRWPKADELGQGGFDLFRTMRGSRERRQRTTPC
jgi:hypothetical protein